MNADLLRHVHRLRRQNPLHPIGIAYAVEIARYERRESTTYPFLSGIEDGPCEVAGELGPLTITVQIVPDHDSHLGDDDVTGTFTDERSDTTVVNTRRDWSTDYEFYEPATIRRDETVAEYSALGMSRAVAREAMRAAIMQDMADDATRAYHGVVVTISVDGRELASGSLWGIDTIDGYAGRGYFIETAEELISEALEQARTEGPRLVAEAEAHAAKITEAITALA